MYFVVVLILIKVKLLYKLKRVFMFFQNVKTQTSYLFTCFTLNLTFVK